ncbi:cell division protein FtsA [Algivirga pacifica]|uniref:Cell division protein FtsA n=1 Tax=Algivirga pacifica TaxID=1162670 RepID=A0ABP9D0C3_9BACT
MSDIIVGLDIGTTKVCAVAGRLDDYGQLEIIGMGSAVSEGVRDGVVSNINRTTTAIQQALIAAEKDAQIEIGIVNVGIAGKHIRSVQQKGGITLRHKDEEITMDDVIRLSNDMYRMITDPGHQIIHVIPQQYTVDHEESIKDPVGMAGVRLDGQFNVITASSNAIRNIKRCVDRAELEIDDLILEPLASSISVLSEEEKEAGVMIVDIGGGTTDVAIFYEGVLRHTAVIPFGGDIITSDIKQGCAVMPQQAELLKVKFGRSLSEEANENEVVSIPGIRNRPPKEISIKNLAYIIEARMDEVIELAMAELRRSGFEHRLTAGVVLTGGGALLKNIKQLFEYRTGLDARIGYPNEHLGKSKRDEIKNPMYATAVGLVLAGFKALEKTSASYDDEHMDGATNKQDNKHRVSDTSSNAGGNFFSSMLRKAKDLLIDDYDDSGYYQ